MSIFFCRKKYVIVFATMMTNMCHLFFMFISDKYMSRVFMYKWKIFMGFRSSMIKRRSDCPIRVLVCLDSIVLTGFVQRRRCLSGKFRTSSLWTWALVLTQLWVSLDLIFSMLFFSFLFIGVCFRFIPWRWRWSGDFVSTLWFFLKIMNMVFWIEDMGSLVMALFCWMHISIQHDWFYPNVAWKG